MKKYKLRGSQQHINHGIYYFLAGVFICAFLFRLLHSVELTDEAYGLAEIYNASFGKKPFIDIWDSHTGWFLLVPFLKLYRFFVPNMEGVVLYFRVLYFLIVVAISEISYRLIRKKKDLLLHFCFFVCISYVSFSIPTFSYNTGVSYLIILTFAFLYNAPGSKNMLARYAGAGISMGVACILYPTMCICSLLLTIPLCCLAEAGARKKAFAAYFSGVAFVGLCFFVWVLAGSGIKTLTTGIKGTIFTPHQAVKGAVNSDFLRTTFKDRLKVYFDDTWRSVFWVLFLICSCIFAVFRTRPFFQYNKWVCFLIIVLICISIFIDPSVALSSRSGYVSFTIFTGSTLLFLLFRRSNRRIWLLLFLVVGWVLTYCFTSDNKNLFAGFDAAGSSVVMFACVMPVLSYEIGRNKEVSAVFRSVVLAAVCLSCFYTYVYRDEPVKEMNSIVQSGIYKGLFTTEARKDFVEDLEADLELNVDPEDSVCTISNMPAVYLMTKSRLCAPQTWDSQYLSRGFTSSEPLLSYFEFVDAYPDVLIGCNYTYSNLFNNDQLEIWDFVNRYYYLAHESSYGSYQTKIWKRTE